MRKKKNKYHLTFKMKVLASLGGGYITLSYDGPDMKDIRKKLSIVKQKGMPWAYDFKLYKISDGSFIRDL